MTKRKTFGEAIGEALAKQDQPQRWNPYAEQLAQLDADIAHADNNPEWAKTLPATRQHDIAVRREFHLNQTQENPA